MVKFGLAFTLMIKDDLLKMEEETEIINYFKNFEKYSLCLESDFLNGKSDVYQLILKCKKYKIDVEQFLKNYEKNEIGKGFSNKMIKIEDAKYDFYPNLVSKPPVETVLFSDDENNNNEIMKPNSGSGTLRNNPVKKNNININDKIKNNEGIIFKEDNKENENLNDNQINNRLAKKNVTTENDIPFNEINPNNKENSNKYNNNSNNNINNKNKNNNNSFRKDNNIEDENNGNINNNNDNMTVDSINNPYYQNIWENIINSETDNNVLENNLYSHQFERFLKINQLDDLHLNNIAINNEKSIIPSMREKNENVGIRIPIGDDISSFIGKKKFSKFKNNIENGNNNNNRKSIPKNNDIILDLEKIKQCC